MIARDWTGWIGLTWITVPELLGLSLSGFFWVESDAGMKQFLISSAV
jgi:hypothetical protein